MSQQYPLSGDTPYVDRKFLIIDDNAVIRTWLRHMVETSGSRKIDEARDFSSAMQKLKSRTQYDVVLCDYNLNDHRDGQQLLEEARRNRLLPPNSVWIMVTGESGYSQIFAAAELTPDDYLIKPFPADRLRERVCKALDRAQVLAAANTCLYAGDYAGCIRACLDATAKDKRYAADLQRLAGEAMLRSGDAQAAHDFFLGLLRTGKSYPWLRLGLARAYFQLNRTDQSYDLLESLILDSPEYLHAQDWMARIKEEMGQPEVAKEILSETLKKNPKALHRHREIVRVALATGDQATAAKAYEALHLHGRGSTFLVPGDFSGYGALLASRKDGATGSRIRNLADNVRNYFSKDKRFDFSRAALDYFHADAIDDNRSRAGAYERMQAAAGNVVEGTEKMVLLKAALQNQDRETVEATARDLFRDYEGNPSMVKQIVDIFPETLREEAQRLHNEAAADLQESEATAIRMAQAGDLDSAIEEFDRLARERPSLRILYNAAVAIAKWIETHCWTPDKGRRLDRYIQGMQRIDPSSPALKRLMEFRARMPQ